MALFVVPSFAKDAPGGSDPDNRAGCFCPIKEQPCIPASWTCETKNLTWDETVKCEYKYDRRQPYPHSCQETKKVKIGGGRACSSTFKRKSCEEMVQTVQQQKGCKLLQVKDKKTGTTGYKCEIKKTQVTLQCQAAHLNPGQDGVRVFVDCFDSDDVPSCRNNKQRGPCMAIITRAEEGCPDEDFAKSGNKDSENCAWVAP